MTTSPKIDVRDLNSVRRAAGHGRVLGDEYAQHAQPEAKPLRRRGVFRLNRSPIARKIITYNLIVLVLMMLALIYLSPSRGNLAQMREDALRREAQVVAGAFSAQLPLGAPVNLMAGDGVNVAQIMASLAPSDGASLFVFDPAQNMIAERHGAQVVRMPSGGWVDRLLRRTPLVAQDPTPEELRARVQPLLSPALSELQSLQGSDRAGRSFFVAAAPITHGGRLVGIVGLSSAAGEVEVLISQERRALRVLFLAGVAVSIVFSLALAATISNPLSDLAAAAERGHGGGSTPTGQSRVRIPDLSGRPDEIGRLAESLRGMVAALYDRIESNEQFAADVAHEIKNPLASLRSAVGTMRVAKRPEQQAQLLDVIEHDVQRLDRLVSDISNASRLDSELVKEEEESFNLCRTLGNIVEYLGDQAQERGIEVISDLPGEDIVIQGLEGRLAQVFVNLITNAISFCEDGDAIRVWVRRRDNRVIAVVEDTGPGIPEEALAKIFQRFYSERPEGQFGNNSGLGLAISKQIVEAHGGVIWAENIRPTAADVTSQPLGARFVVGLPL